MVRRKTKPKRKARKRKGGAIQQLGNMRFEEASHMQRHEAVRDAWMNYQKTSEHPVEWSPMNHHEAVRDAWMNYKKTEGAGFSTSVNMRKKTGKRKKRYSGKRGGCISADSFNRPPQTAAQRAASQAKSNAQISDWYKQAGLKPGSTAQPRFVRPTNPPARGLWGDLFSQVKGSFHHQPLSRMAHHQPRMASLRHQPRAGSWGAGLRGGC